MYLRLEAQHHAAGEVNDRADSKLALFTCKECNHLAELIWLTETAGRQSLETGLCSGVIIVNGAVSHVSYASGHNAVADDALVCKVLQAAL